MQHVRAIQEEAVATVRDANVLVLSPHPDDELIGCGGTVTRLMTQGARVTVIQATDGCDAASLVHATEGERRSIRLTSNLVFGQWDRIYRDQMATAAAIDRLVHHAVLLEFDVPSYRTERAKRRGSADARTARS